MKQDRKISDFDHTLLTSYLSGRATAQEEQALWAWICESDESGRAFAELRAVWQRGRLSHSDAQLPARFARSLNALNRRIDALDTTAPVRKSRLVTLRRFAAVAAVVVFVVAAFMTYRITTAPQVHRFHNPDTIAMHVTMPDGTDVWLGPRTTLSYDDRFRVEGRNVELDGEAYFDVTHDALHPFVVATSAFHVRVLGTVFNVRSYKGEAVGEATLAEGSVALQHVGGRSLVYLHPGQQAVYDSHAEMLEVNEVPVGNLLQIRYGVITLNDAALPEIVRCIEQTYGLGLRFEAQQGSHEHYNFSFQKDAPVEDVVDLLEFVSGCHFEIIQLNP
ncbi:FecR family protein [uncultured Alistipes sp.]|uniref:FecR family protein n=2 Tax=uncultured Alistipes sp. TaxID=538949 RepID=UPI0025E9AADC|nr:FecR family protein [uncultured Alistipes sp.]